MAFHHIPGNARIKTILQASLQRNRVPPTLLFSGPEGVGKRDTAVELAKALNCLRLRDDACDACASCLAINARHHPDIIDVKTLPVKNDKNKNSESENDLKEITVIKIEQIRQAIGLASMRPMTARKRVFIIDDAKELTDDASNSYLKLLEEPPSFTQFVLITSNVDLLLPTVRSRCQNLVFGSIASEDIVAALLDRGFEETQSRIMALIVRGNLDQAMTMDWEEVRAEREEAWSLFRSILLGDGGSAFLRRFAYGRKTASREELEATLELFSGFLRDLLFLGETGGTDRLLNPDLEAALRDVAPVLSPERTLRMLSAVDGAIAFLDRKLNAGLLASAFYARMTG